MSNIESTGSSEQNQLNKLSVPDCQAQASKSSLNDALSAEIPAAALPARANYFAGQEAFQPSLKTSEADRPDVSSGLFDENAPISHFDRVADGVYRSGRPRGEEGIKEAVEKVWGDQQFNPDHARQTAVVELRGPSSGKYYQQNEDEINKEAASESDLGLAHARFPLQTHQIVDPAFIQSVLDYIDGEKAQGKRVLIHCYHGTDRTGIISAAYKLTHDLPLQQVLRDDPAGAYKRGLKTMTDNGFSPELFPELCQSLNNFVNWKSSRMDGLLSQKNKAGQTDGYIDIPSIWH